MNPWEIREREKKTLGAVQVLSSVAKGDLGFVSRSCRRLDSSFYAGLGRRVSLSVYIRLLSCLQNGALGLFLGRADRAGVENGAGTKKQNSEQAEQADVFY